MTEKTTPELPFKLAEDEDGDTLNLKWDEVEGRYFVTIPERNPWVDPAELMCNLARFVPEVEPVAVLDRDQDLWLKGDEGVWACGGRNQASVWRSWRDVYAQFGGVALYAHPPVTAEPAAAPSEPTTHFTVREDGTVLQNLPIRTTAPSVEQMRRVMRDGPWLVTQQEELAEAIHALYGSGDAGETVPQADLAQHWKEQARMAEARVRELEEMVRHREEMENTNAREVARLRGEVERYKAALKAAEKHISALSRRFEAEKGQWAAETNVFHRTRDTVKTSQAWDAARAAVEGETSEEADRG